MDFLQTPRASLGTWIKFMFNWKAVVIVFPKRFWGKKNVLHKSTCLLWKMNDLYLLQYLDHWLKSFQNKNMDVYSSQGLQANNKTKTHKLQFQQENLAEICWKSLPQTTCEKRFSAPFYKLHASCVLKPTKSCNGISTNQYTAYTRRGLEFNEGQGPK